MHFILVTAIFLQVSLCSRDEILEYEMNTKINFQGTSATITLSQRECRSFPLLNKMYSINTRGHCARIYKNRNCNGLSKFVHPYSLSHNNLKSLGFNNGVLSVSQCFKGDVCESSKSCESATKQFVIGYNSELPVDNKDVKPPVKYYQTVNNRTVMMAAYVEVHHLETGTSFDNKTVSWARSKGHEDDQAGYILPKRLGGSGTDLRNIFPQSNALFTTWHMQDVEDIVKFTVENEGKAIISSTLLYNDANSTRPFSIIYEILGDESDEISYNFEVLNP